MLTKETMQKMKEDELSQKVLIPLFREMGFQDVDYHHGGSGEQGKDIVFWKQDELQTRKNYAVVAKATNISGQAKGGKGTAGEVATQIQQAFGDDYLDSVTSEPQVVHECWVVSNQKISKEGKTSIRSVLKSSNFHRHVRFISGDKLWELVEQYLAHQTLMGKFQMIQKELSNVDTHYSPIVQLSSDKMNLSLTEKFKGAAEEKPLDFSFSFQFPDTPAGQAAKTALDQHFATGVPVSISPEFISSIEYPEIIKSLFGADDIETPTLEISPLSNGHHFIARIEIECDDGDKFNVDHVDFVVKHSGTEEATLENVESASLLRIKLIVNLAKHTAKLTFSWQLPKQTYSCSQLLQFLEFQNCSSKPFNLRIISKEFGVEVFSQRSKQGITTPPPKFYLSMYRVLDKLQRKSNKLIMIPIRALTDEEIKDISELVHIVHTGKIKGKWTEFKVTLQDLSADAFNALSEQAFFFRLVGEETENIFGVELPLGEVETVFHNGLIANLDEIRKVYNSGDRNIHLHLVAQNGEAEFEKIYSDFPPNESVEDT